MAPDSALPGLDPFPSGLPDLDLEDLLARAHVVRLPMRVRFRGITAREAVVFPGPAGWGEFAPFPEYEDAEAASWLRAGLEASHLGPPAPCRTTVPVNATVPAVPAGQVRAVLARFPGCTVAKVKVAEPGQQLADDVERVAAVRAALGPGGAVRVDANGGWTVPAAAAALRRLIADGPLDYAEQPCRSVEELADLRERLNGCCDIAADESIRRAADPMRVAELGAADVAVVKVAPLGGMRSVLAVAAALRAGAGMRVTVSSALDTGIGISAGIAAAAALPDTRPGGPNAAGLATGNFFAADTVTHPLVSGNVAVAAPAPSASALAAVELAGERRQWWLDRMRRCLARI